MNQKLNEMKEKFKNELLRNESQFLMKSDH